MSKSLEYVLHNGKSDAEMAILSHHKSIDTTTNHYIEAELEKMLECTHGITIGNIYTDTNNKVVDNLPDKFQGVDRKVENGCGACTAKSCTMIGQLPCLVCPSFCTTPKHKIYFQKTIEDVDRLIKNTENRHEKDDLVTIKTLLVLYLKAIAKFEEDKEESS